MSKKSPNIRIEGIITREQVDSDEELWFTWYCEELIEKGILLAAEINKKPIPLSEPVEHSYMLHMKKKSLKKTEHLMHGHEYTPDFRMYPNMRYRNVFYSVFVKGEKMPKQKIPFISMNDTEHDVVIEIKPAFDRHNMTRLVRTNLKWVFDKYLMHIQLVKVPEIFEKTFTPKKYILLMNSKRKPGTSKIKFKVKTIDEYVAELDEARNRLTKATSQMPIVEI